MKSSLIGAAVLSAIAVRAQNMSMNWAGTTLKSFAGMIPPCAVYCDYEVLTNDGCDPDDFTCHCARTGLVASLIVPCLANSTCTDIDIGVGFARYVDEACAYFNATANSTTPAPTPSASSISSASSAPAGTGSPIPPNYTPSATTQLLVSFQTGSVQVSPGQVLGIDIPARFGEIALQQLPENNQVSEPATAASIYQVPTVQVFGPNTYLAIMIDPDAPTPASPTLSPLLHLMQPGLRLINASTIPAHGPFPFLFFANATSTPAKVPYARPMPPPTSPAHRYIMYVFEEPLGFTIPEEYSGLSATNRTNFDFTGFIEAAGLGNPIAANYFYVSNSTGSIAPNATAPGPSGTGSAPTPPSPTVSMFMGGASSFGMNLLGMAGVAAAGFALGL